MLKILDSQNLHWIAIGLMALFLLYNLFLMIRYIYLRRHPEAVYGRLSNSRMVKYWKVFETVTMALMLMPIVISLLLTPKVISPTDPAMGATEVSNLKPVEMIFDYPIDRSSLKASITPDLPGKWQTDSGIISGHGKVVFTPSQSPILDSRYTVSIDGIKNIWSYSSSKYLFSFQTLPLPSVHEISISEADEGVLPDQSIDFKIDHFPAQTVQIDFELAPALALAVENDNDTYRVKPMSGYQKGTNYSLKVFRTLLICDYSNGVTREAGEKTEIKSLNFKTVDAPSVKSTSPSGSGVLADTNISVEFKQDMEINSVESAFSISPQVAGVFSWDGKRKATFNPNDNLAKNTGYKVIISKSASTAGGEALQEDVNFSFTTIGYVMVSKFVPANGASGIATNTAVTVSFNQAIDHVSAQSKFVISPTIAGTFSWSGDSMTFQHGDFASNTKYTVSVESGVKTVNGLDSKDQFGTVFTTKIPSTSLNVPSYKQAHMYSCMATAARNALAFKGVNLSEATILSSIGYDSTSWSGTWAEGGAVWGDPDAGIVGSVDGKADNIGWGYGSHWGPVANAINSFGRTAEVKNGWDVSGIASEIAAGNPVIVWWVNGVWPAYVVNWKTSGGKSVRGVNSLHVQTVKAFTGTVDNPLSFTVTDSGYGYPNQTFDVGTFKAKWSWFSNTAIIVK